MTPIHRLLLACVLIAAIVTGRCETSRSTPATRLFVSNVPERVSAPRILYEGRLRDDGVVRLLYHHLNDGAGPLHFSIELLNPAATSVQLQVIDAFAAPNTSELTVGHLATLRYAEREERNTGYVVTVPAASVLSIHTEKWRARGVVSGLARLRMLTVGGVVIIRLRAHAQESARISALNAYSPSAVMGDYAFISTALSFTGSYTVGDNWLFFSLGDVLIPGERPGQYLAGAYGVWHNYAMTLINPTPRPATVIVTITPAAGAARLVYSFGDRWQETSTLSAYREETLATYTLPPGARKAIRLTAMPQSGSNYPMRLSVHVK